MRLPAPIGKYSKTILTLLGLLCVLLLGFFDYLSGPEMSFSVFFLVPISVVAWFVGKKAGIVVSVCAAVSWFAADWMTTHYSHPAYTFWNATVRLIFFVIVSVLLSKLKATKSGLEERFKDNTAALSEEIDGHKRTSKSLRDSEEQIRILVENVEDYAVFMLDPAGCVVSWNKGAQRLYGYEASEIIGKHFSHSYPAEDVEHGRAHEAMTVAMAEGVFKDEGWRLRKDGSRFWASAVLTALRNEHGQLQGFFRVIHDITSRKQLEEELLTVEELERQKIGRDLHDTLGQDLTAIAFLAKDLEESLTGQSLSQAREAGRITEHLNRTIKRTGSLVKGLWPVDLGSDGLMSAFKDLAAAASNVFGIPCDFRFDQPIAVSDETAALHLYRIAQEAVNNAIKHAKAKCITISLTSSREGNILRIEDDGVGLPKDVQKSTGMGLRVMDYRAKSIGGSLSVERSRNDRTVVSCSFPGGLIREQPKNDK